MRYCHFCDRLIQPDDDRYASPVCPPCADAIRDVLES